jgi:GT2 family glycosyltransferase
MTDIPLFSIIIPTYHRNDLLAKCLDCLAPGVQTLPAEQYEVIVSDDGYESTAQEMIQQNYPWVKWVAGFRKGPAANRNNGAKYATGEWLAFTDDDCLPDPQWLESYGEAIASNVWIYEGKTICDTTITSPLQHAPINMTGGCLWSCNMMIQTSLFIDLKGFDENFPYPHLEDVDFRERIKKQGYTFSFVDKAKINHPQKRLPYGKKLGKLHECDMYYWLKNNDDSSIVRIAIAIIRTRLITIIRFPIQPDSLSALASLLEELFFTIRNWGAWKVYYSSQLETRDTL